MGGGRLLVGKGEQQREEKREKRKGRDGRWRYGMVRSGRVEMEERNGEGKEMKVHRNGSVQRKSIREW